MGNTDTGVFVGKIIIYVASSWRNENQPKFVQKWWSQGHEAYDFVLNVNAVKFFRLSNGRVYRDFEF